MTCLPCLWYDQNGEYGMKDLQKDIIISLSLFAACLAIYEVNGVAMPGGDSVASRYIPLSLLCEHDLDLNEMPLRIIKPDGKISQPYFLLPARKGRQVATFGPLPGIMAFPVFFVANLFSHRFSFQRIMSLAKLAASILIALSVILLYLVLISLTGRFGAVTLALIYGLATSAWSMMSQALWQHTAALPWLIAALLVMVRGRQRPNLIPWAGLFLGLAVVARPSDLVIAVVFTIYVWLHHRKQFPAFIALAAIPALMQAAYNQFYFGSPILFGQAVLNQFLHTHTKIMSSWACPNCANWDTSPTAALKAFAGLLVSPSRGIFIFSPILLIGLWGLAASMRRHGNPLLRWSLAAFLGVVLLHSFRHDWWGGWSFGYRYTMDAVPLLILGMAPMWPKLKSSRAFARMASILLVFSLLVQLLGAFSYNLVGWNAQPDVNSHPQRLWSLTDSQIVYYIKHFKIRRDYHGYDTPPATITVCPVRIVNPQKKNQKQR